MTVVIGAVPPEEALRALRTRGSAPFKSFSWQDVDPAEHANGFTVAKSAGFDIETDIFDAVLKRTQSGQTIPAAIKDLRPILEEKGWWGRKDVVDPLTGETVTAQLGSTRRLELIFSVNARVSYAAGHWARFEAQKRIRPYLRYVAILDGRTRPEHALWHNVCLPVDHPWWETHAPPNGWNCRCTLQSLTERDVARMRDRLKMEPPTIEMRTWVNGRTGEETELPVGIDPGWGHNPGKVGHQAAALAADKLIAAPPALAAARAQDPTFTAAIAGEFASWAETVIARRRVTRPTLVAGAFDPQAVALFEARGEPLSSAAIQVSQNRIEHALRDSKSALGNTVDPQLLVRLPETIKTATALVQDRRDMSVLVYVVPTADPEVRAKIVIRIGRTTKHMDGLRSRQTVTVNEFVTAGLVRASELRNAGAYQLIWGVI